MMNEVLIRNAFKRFMIKMTLNNLMVFSGPVVNGIVISRYLGTDAMAAYQIVLPLVFVVMMFSQIISLGVQNNCAKSLGAGREEDAREYYSAAIVFALPLSLLLVFAVFEWADVIVALLGANGVAANLAFDAAEYLKGFSFGIPLLMILPMQIAVFFLEGRAKCAIRAILAQTAVNIVGAFANAIYFEGGMFGMGLLMTVCYFVSFCIMAEGIRESCIRFVLRPLRRRWILPVLRIGLPSAIDRFYKSTQMFVINRVLLLVAPGAAIAAFADINALNNVFNPIVMGLSATTLTMAGVFTGEHDKNSLDALLRIAIKYSLVATLPVALFTTLAAPQIIGLFVTEEGEAFNAAVRSLSIYIWYLPLRAVNNVLQKYYLGINAMKMTYLTSLLDNFLFVCLLSAALGYCFGADGKSPPRTYLQFPKLTTARKRHIAQVMKFAAR